MPASTYLFPVNISTNAMLPCRNPMDLTKHNFSHIAQSTQKRILNAGRSFRASFKLDEQWDNRGT